MATDFRLRETKVSKNLKGKADLAHDIRSALRPMAGAMPGNHIVLQTYLSENIYFAVH